MKISIERSDNDGFIVTQEGKDRYKHVILEEDLASSIQEMINLSLELLGFIVEEAPDTAQGNIGFKINNKEK
jgi:hypothetical protein